MKETADKINEVTKKVMVLLHPVDAFIAQISLSRVLIHICLSTGVSKDTVLSAMSVAWDRYEARYRAANDNDKLH